MTANFISCDLRCEFEDSDGVPKQVDTERTKPLCRHCGSDNLQEYKGMADANGCQLWHCHDCGFASLI